MSKFSPLDAIWTEKYRPKRIADIVGDFKEKVLEHMKNPMSMPSFLFYSRSPGTGKSSTVKAIANEIGCDVLIINSSSDRKIETIRDRVKEFSMSKSSKEGIKRCVILEEVDGMCLPLGTEIFKGTKLFPNIKKIENIPENCYVHIPSVNVRTGKIENDKGMLVNSGVADFFEIELEDGRKIVASKNHPFFKENFVETKLCDLKVGDSIIDYSDEIYKNCPVCSKRMLHRRVTCSMDCKNKYHSLTTLGKDNCRYGIKHSDETKRLISKRLMGRTESVEKRKAQSEFMKLHNPMCNPESRKKISIKNTGRIISESARKKSSITNTLHLGTDKYEIFCKENNRPYSFKHQFLKRKKTNNINCQICNKKLLTKGNKAGMQIHHIDMNRNNNSDSNMALLCAACHYAVHRGKLLNSYKKPCTGYVSWLKMYKEKILSLNIILYGEVA